MRCVFDTLVLVRLCDDGRVACARVCVCFVHGLLCQHCRDRPCCCVVALHVLTLLLFLRFASPYRINSTAAEVKETFNLFNKSGSGVISAAELKEIMVALGEQVNDEVSRREYAARSWHERRVTLRLMCIRAHCTYTVTQTHTHTHTNTHTFSPIAFHCKRPTLSGHCQDDQDCRHERQGWCVLC